MKNMRKLLAVTLLLITLGLPVYADSGQMDTPKPGSGVVAPPPSSTGSDATQTPDGQMDATLTAVLGVIESILALI